jgi:tRNA/rRNA methyltransferase
LAEHEQGRDPGERSPVRGLSRLLRRNPTDAERVLWQALTKDRRFAGCGFKRQTPIGRHVTDFVAFPLRLVIDLVPDDEGADAARQRADKHAWLVDRGYRVIAVRRRSRGRCRQGARPACGGAQALEPSTSRQPDAGTPCRSRPR